MKTIGLIGGMSWESTVSYYQAINKGINEQLGGLHSAKLVLYSVDFAEIERHQHQGEWDKAATILINAASALEQAGADAVLICTNTMHKVAEKVEAAITIPLIHIADSTAHTLQQNHVTTVGLLGTRFTMEEDFYKQRLEDNFNINVLTPSKPHRDLIHNVIYEQLCKGVICEASREAYIEVIELLGAQGAQAVILGCTEIALLVNQSHTTMPLYDTTTIHANAAINFALQARVLVP